MAKERILWTIVKNIIRENYEILIEERIRDGFYIVRDYLSPMIGAEITEEDYRYFLSDQGYSYYRDDLWVSLEQKEGYKRPEAKPDGSVWDRGSREPIEHLRSVWQQARGFIFTEKSGEKLSKLSEYGWVIVEPAQGYPTRLIREILKEDTRPVLAIHDADKAGEGIFRALGFTTKRTNHLDIAIDNVSDLGLRWDDVKKLDLPTQLEAEKYRTEKEDRCEIQALVVLKTRMGVENPFLQYVVMRMLQEGVPISPTPISKRRLLIRELRWEIQSRLNEIIEPVIVEFVDRLRLEGDAVDVNLPSSETELEVLADQITELSSKMEKEKEWVFEDDFQAAIVGQLSEELREKFMG